MSQEPGEGLRLPELQPEMQPIEAESESTASQESAGYYASVGYAPPTPEPSPTHGLRWAFVGVAAAVAVTAGAWFALSPPAPPVPVPAVAAPAQTNEVELASDGAADIKATEYLKGMLGSQATEIVRGGYSAAQAGDSTEGGPLQAVNAAALIELGKTAPEIAKDISSGQRLLYPIRLCDEVEGDMYHAKLFVDGADVGDIYEGKGNFLVPLIPGRPAHLKVVITLDRGGMGVPVGLILPSGELWRTGIIPLGGSEERQVTVP